MVATDLLEARQRGELPQRRRITRLVVTVSIVVLMFVGSDWLAQQLSLQDAGTVEFAVIATLVLYVVVMALPFVPGIEIGLVMMMMLGQGGILLVYLATLFALALSFLLGRIVPVRSIAAVFRWLRLVRAHALLGELARIAPVQRIDYLAKRAPTGRLGTLLRHRYLALALVLNLPGNALLGGAGGIGMIAGMSRAYRFFHFVLAVALATTPVPLLFLLGGAAPVPF